MLFPASKVSVSFIEAKRENLHVDCRDEARSEKSQEEGRVEGRKKGSSPFLFLPSLTCDFSTYSSNVGLRGRNVQIFITVVRWLSHHTSPEEAFVFYSAKSCFSKASSNPRT